MSLIKPGCIFITSFLAAQLASAQHSWLAAGAAYISDRYTIEDEHGLMRTVPLPGVEWTLNYGRSFKNNMYTDVAISTKPYSEGVGFENAFSYGTSEAFRAINANAGIGYRMRATNRISLLPNGGFGLGINTSTYMASGRGGGATSANGVMVRYTHVDNANVNRVFALVHASLTLEWDIFNSPFDIRTKLGYHAGFVKAHQLDISYTVNQSSPYDATAISKGNYWELGVGLVYQISRFAEPRTKN